ncbi:nuclear transport factor 2 family protein [Geodermatophilus marinus]|uniref:nuclear transport factor 2 family protein n=1 Tax=Geodermatophilus sp. LHW52908 TaxID=2303986 RepID=UPI000E3D522E|nr:nuclear transport factor 2 family protein [Geodermatophilus sp. LHW52908]RFU21182.1 nuclear transport factor 2 family protein [Geodermatophilus sp. LHW52908]
MTQTVSSNVEVMKDLYEAFARGDIETVLARMADDIEWYEAEGNPWHPGRAFRGRQEVVDGVIQRIAEEYEGFQVLPHRFIAGGDTVVVEARYAAPRCRATGKALDAQVAHVWDLRDGKVVRFQQYVDTRHLADVLGA